MHCFCGHEELYHNKGMGKCNSLMMRSKETCECTNYIMDDWPNDAPDDLTSNNEMKIRS
jgi:hypothetical protein